MATAGVGSDFAGWLRERGYKVELAPWGARRPYRVHLHSTARRARSELNKLWMEWAQPHFISWEVVHPSLPYGGFKTLHHYALMDLKGYIEDLSKVFPEYAATVYANVATSRCYYTQVYKVRSIEQLRKIHASFNG